MIRNYHNYYFKLWSIMGIRFFIIISFLIKNSAFTGL